MIEITQHQEKLRLTVPAPQIAYLVFSGGGAKGAVYPGAYRALSDYGLMRSIKAIAGSSAGALTAGLIACGMKPDKLIDIMENINFVDLLDKTTTKAPKIKRSGQLLLEFMQDNIAASIRSRLADLKYQSIDNIGDEITDNEKLAIRQLFLPDNKSVTFKMLSILHKLAPHIFKELVVTAVDEDGKLQILNKHTPDVKIAEACRASAAIPVLLTGQRMEIDGKETVLKDGGLVDNLPTDYFPDICYESTTFPNKTTQILVLAFGEGADDKNPIHNALYQQNNPIYKYDFFESLKRNVAVRAIDGININNTANKASGYEKLRHRFPLKTVELKVNVKTTQFKKANELFAELEESGHTGMCQYLDNHDLGKGLISHDFDNKFQLLFSVSNDMLERLYTNEQINLHPLDWYEDICPIYHTRKMLDQLLSDTIESNVIESDEWDNLRKYMRSIVKTPGSVFQIASYEYVVNSLLEKKLLGFKNLDITLERRLLIFQEIFAGVIVDRCMLNIVKDREEAYAFNCLKDEILTTLMHTQHKVNQTNSRNLRVCYLAMQVSENFGQMTDALDVLYKSYGILQSKGNLSGVKRVIKTLLDKAEKYQKEYGGDIIPDEITTAAPSQ